MHVKISVLLILTIFSNPSLQKPGEEFLSTVLSHQKDPNRFKFGEKTYYVGTVFTANFYRALQFCRQQGMHLLSINSKAENERIGKFIADNDYSYKHFWTSATNLAGENEWIWLSTGQHVLYTNWSPGEPNQAHNSTENCIEIRFWGPSGFTWNDLSCEAQMYFICESIVDCPVPSNN